MKIEQIKQNIENNKKSIDSIQILDLSKQNQSNRLKKVIKNTTQSLIISIKRLNRNWIMI
jgi:hypothetical protein